MPPLKKKAVLPTHLPHRVITSEETSIFLTDSGLAFELSGVFLGKVPDSVFEELNKKHEHGEHGPNPADIRAAIIKAKEGERPVLEPPKPLAGSKVIGKRGRPLKQIPTDETEY